MNCVEYDVITLPSLRESLPRNDVVSSGYNRVYV